MAITCQLPSQPVTIPPFIQCDSISISYEINGLASISFTVISSSKTINLQNYTTITVGTNNTSRTTGSFTAGRVRFRGIITSYEISPITGTLVYEHRLQLTAWGCRI